MVHVRVFFSVYLDAHEMLIHIGCGMLILKTLPLHNMAPVACCIPYAHDNRFVLGFGFGKCFVTPRIPIYGVVGMLQ